MAHGRTVESNDQERDVADYRSVHRRRRVRMSDVARVAGVSTTTVSLVLNDKAGSSIPDGTKERVFEASRVLGYRAHTDRMAMGVFRAIRRAGLSVPNDISVIGFDNQDQIAPWLDPPLTTMQLPHEAMGGWAVEHLLRVLSGEAEGPRQQRLECPLVVRDSVAPPRNGAGQPPRPKRGTS